MARAWRIACIVLMFLAMPLSAQEAEGGKVNCIRRGLSAAQFGKEVLSTTTGVAPLDHFITDQSVKLMTMFRVVPELYYIMEGEIDNAIASPETTTPFSKGTVLLGRELLLSQMAASDRGFPAIVGILAHEFAHILQFTSEGAIGSSAEIELHADFLAGYYLGRQGFMLPEEVDVFAHSLFTFGDDPEVLQEPDHGSGDQRVAAMLSGYHHHTLPLREAYQQGIDRARELLGSFQDLGSGLPEIPDALHDVQARSSLRSDARPIAFHNHTRNPHAAYAVRYHNAGTQPVIVKAVIESRVEPIARADGDPGTEGDQEPDSSRILTRRAFQFRLAPGESRRLQGEIRSTSQSEIVRTVVVPREVVVFADAAPSPGPSTGAQ